MYEDRGKLHKEGYQHRVTKTVDCMMVSPSLNALFLFLIVSFQDGYHDACR